MEFLRLGSSIPGSYWGCCAVCLIQDFNQDPDAKSSIQIVDGDGGSPLTNSKGFMFAGPTYKDIFLQRLRYGTFGSGDMPNHAFLAVLTGNQIRGSVGKKWLSLLKENGFEFLRTIDNSVYSGPRVIAKAGQSTTSSHPNYLFGLFRNIGTGAVADPYTPPKEWTDLPSVAPETWEALGLDSVGLTARVQEAQLPLYNALPKGQFMSEKELEEAGVPVIYAGVRSRLPQQPKPQREQAVADMNKDKPASAAAPFVASIDSSDFEESMEDNYDCDDSVSCAMVSDKEGADALLSGLG